MKAFFTFLLSAFSLLCIISCSSDDDTPPPPPPPAQEELIVGNWDMSSTTVEDGSASRSIQGFPATFSFTGEGKNYDYQLSFTEDKELGEQGSFTMILTYSLLGQSIEQEIPVEVDDSGGLLLSGSYEIEDSQLFVSKDNQTVNATIDELTETNLNLSIDLAELAPTLFNNEIQNVSGTIKMTFSRIE